MSDRDQVFLSYSAEDFKKVQKLYTGLKKRGINVWFDRADLGPGTWRRQIEKAISRSRYFLLCLSEAALRRIGNKPGFQDEELNRAFQIAVAQPDRRNEEGQVSTFNIKNQILS